MTNCIDLVCDIPESRSSSIRKVEWNGETQDLGIIFKSNLKFDPGTKYIYKQVPLNIIQEFMNVILSGDTSIGTFFCVKIKSKFEFAKVETNKEQK